MNFKNVEVFTNKLMISLLLIGTGIVVTWTGMTIMHLKETNAQLELRASELKTSLVILENVQKQLQEENETLSK